jgi:hypothetical protein
MWFSMISSRILSFQKVSTSVTPECLSEGIQLALRIVTGGLHKQSIRGCGPLLLYLFIDIIL